MTPEPIGAGVFTLAAVFALPAIDRAAAWSRARRRRRADARFARAHRAGRR